MKVKLISTDAIVPRAQRSGDAGLDVYSPVAVSILPSARAQIKLGIAIEIGQDEVCVVSERSGMAIKNGVHSIGNIIDSNYRGEISIILQNEGNETLNVYKGDRVGQLLILKLGDRSIELVNELSDSERGTLNHGSSGV